MTTSRQGGSSNAFALIRSRYNTLSASQRAVADYVLSNAESVMTKSLGELAAACSVSEPTVMRFLRKLDYESYQVFRVNIAQELTRADVASGGTLPLYDEVQTSDSVPQVIEKVILSTAQSITDSRQIIDPAAVEAIRDAILAARHVVVTGIGASAAIAFDLHHKLLKLSLSTSFSHDPHMINIMCGNLTEKDLLITFSHSGESREMLDAVRIACENGCKVAAITSYPRSSLALAADWVVLSSSKETKFRSDALTSRIIQICITDMLYISLALKMGAPALESITRSRVAVAKNKT